MRNILILDLSSVLHSVKFSLGKHKLSYKEKPTFVIYGFLNSLYAYQTKVRPDIIVVACDSRTSIRKELYHLYKHKRQKKTPEQAALDKIALPQFETVRYEILPELGCRNIFGVDGLEADDVIGRICKMRQYKNDYITIATTDKDIYQCLRHNVRIINSKNKTFYTLKDFQREYEIEPKMWKRVKAYGGCFDKKTEILTDRGWLFFNDLKFNDKVYSMNPITRLAQYENIKNIIKYKYKGDMYKIKGRLIDLLVTPNHKFFGSTTQSYPTKDSNYLVNFKEIHEIVKYKNFTIPITSTWEGKYKKYFILPKLQTSWENECKVRGKFVSNRLHKKQNIDMNIWLAFFGIWLANGYTTKNANDKVGTVGISANKERKLKYFQPILDKTPWKWIRGKNGWRTDNRQLAMYLHKIGNVYNKFIPKEFLDLCPEQLQILFDALISGDGCVSKYKNNCFGTSHTSVETSFYSSNVNLINNFQEISIKLGFATVFNTKPAGKYNINGKSGYTKKSYSVKLLKSNNTNICKKEITKIDFDDYVFDVETEPNHTIFVRRNRNTVWSSNCTSDCIKGLPIPNSTKCIGEGYALKYVKGELPHHYKAYQAFINTKNKKILKLNKELVILPHNSTPEFKIRPNYFKRKGLINICKKYGFASILSMRKQWFSLLRMK